MLATCKFSTITIFFSHLLMSGIPTGELYQAIKYEFPKLASKKAVFGNKGYYFTNCSTKAANQCVLDNWTHEFENQRFSENWKYERGADQGTHKPENGGILYIMFSEVALGEVKNADSDDKYGISRYDRCGSLVFYGLYTNEQYQMVTRVTESKSYDVIVPRGPFVRNDKVRKASLNDANFFYYDEIYVQNIAQINPHMLAQVQYFSG
ncbi:hypothetical protein M3Y97_00996900 [Aphelenchoides bicaudatus]|nr:hypothetical protein M3Y97_00996900 [Aphelenchoides bicaudatus]